MHNVQQLLERYYHIKGISSITKPTLGGFINESYVIETKQKHYFFQFVDTKRLLHLEMDVFSHLAKHNFPTPKVVFTKNDKPFVELEGKFAILTEFIHGHSPEKFNDLTNLQLENAAKVLARFHKLMQDFTKPLVENSRKNTATKKQALRICQEIEEIVKNKNELDAFDTQVVKIINKKISLLEKFDENKLNQQLAQCPKIFCHGDFHGANLIFNNEEKVIGVVDWEFVGADYRIFEVARSMAFMCDVNYTGSMLSPIDFEKARIYLEAYQQVNPLTKEELDVMSQLLEFKSLCSCFVLEEHYQKGNRHTDVFLPKQESDWFFWQAQAEEFKVKVIEK